jgi:DNA-binding NarL/FixJ family response regulator
MLSVLLADDDQLTRTGLRLIIESDPDLRVVGEAADGQEAIHLARALHPDVVLMDVRMPGVDGLEATRRIVEAAQDGPRVLILTTFELDEYVFGALRAGASGFLLKRSSPEVLIEGVKVVASGDGLLAPSVTRRSRRRLPSRCSLSGNGRSSPWSVLASPTGRWRPASISARRPSRPTSSAF